MRKRILSVILSVVIVLGMFSMYNISIFAATSVDILPVATVINGDRMYSIYNISKTWTDANTICTSSGGRLIAINSPAENTFILNLIQQYGGGNRFWTDGIRSGSGFTWGSGEQLTYSNWSTSQPDNAGGTEDRIELSAGLGYKWNDVPSATLLCFIKEIVINYTPKATLNFGGHKYLLFDNALTWLEAKKYSESIGANLASINSVEEQQAVYNLLKTNGTKDHYVIGGTDAGFEGTWRWDDGSSWSYNNFVAPQPDNYSGVENYLEIYKSTGTWNDMPNCWVNDAQALFGFICEMPVKYTVSFNANGGTGTNNSMDFTYDESKMLNANTFTRTGYYFDSWNTNADGKGKKYTDNQIASNLTQTDTTNVVLYAIWRPSQATISFESNGGSAVAYKDYSYEQTYGTIQKPTKKDYIFDGWYKNADFSGTKIASTDKVTSTHTLYAKWVKKLEFSTVAFNVSTAFSKKGGTAKIIVNISEKSQIGAGLFKLNYDKTKLKPLLIETGTVFKNGSVVKNISATGDISISYSHTIALNEGGRIFEVDFEVIGDVPQGKVLDEVAVNFEATDLFSYNYCDIPYTVQNGKVSITSINFGDINGTDGVTPTDALMALSVIAQKTTLTPEQKIRADIDGDNQITSTDALSILQYTAGLISDYLIFNILPPESFQVDSKTETTANFSWKKVNYCIGYNIYKDGVKQNDAPITSTTYTVNNLVQDTKYNFTIEAVNSLKASEKSDDLIVSTNKAERTVTFKDYDGKVLATKVVLSGTNVTAPTSPIRTGYTFKEWDKSLANITLDTVITATYTINNYTVMFDSMGGSAVAPQTKAYDTLLAMPIAPTRTDYTFDGWYADSTYAISWNFETDKLQKNTTLYAKWITWSEWTTTVPKGIDETKYTIQSRVEYRSRTKSTTTDSASTKSGWVLYDTRITDWGPWSGWYNWQIQAETWREVRPQTIAATYKTVWRYNRWVYNNGQTSTFNGNYGGSYQTIELDYRLTYLDSGYGSARYGSYVYGGNTYLQRWWWNESSSQVETSPAYTQWMYRDAIYTYYYYQWSAWSVWSTAFVTANDNTEVQTQTVYRYIPKQV